MSLLGQKLPLPAILATSALPLKADIQRMPWHVRSVPGTDVAVKVALMDLLRALRQLT